MVPGKGRPGRRVQGNRRPGSGERAPGGFAQRHQPALPPGCPLLHPAHIGLGGCSRQSGRHSPHEAHQRVHGRAFPAQLKPHVAGGGAAHHRLTAPALDASVGPLAGAGDGAAAVGPHLAVRLRARALAGVTALYASPLCRRPLPVLAGRGGPREPGPHAGRRHVHPRSGRIGQALRGHAAQGLQLV